MIFTYASVLIVKIKGVKIFTHEHTFTVCRLTGEWFQYICTDKISLHKTNRQKFGCDEVNKVDDKRTLKNEWGNVACWV